MCAAYIALTFCSYTGRSGSAKYVDIRTNVHLLDIWTYTLRARLILDFRVVIWVSLCTYSSNRERNSGKLRRGLMPIVFPEVRRANSDTDCGIGHPVSCVHWPVLIYVTVWLIDACLPTRHEYRAKVMSRDPR